VDGLSFHGLELVTDTHGSAPHVTSGMTGSSISGSHLGVDTGSVNYHLEPAPLEFSGEFRGGGVLNPGIF
jgi:hypothetical protein